MRADAAVMLSIFLALGAGTAWASGAAPAPSAKLLLAADATNALGLDLYAQFRSSKDNVFFSPYSLACAMAMAYAGARGETATQMATVLHFQGKSNAIHESFSLLIGLVNREANQGCELSTANALWVQNGYALLPQYANAIQTLYQATVQNVDFVGSPAQACGLINAWTAQKTANRIPDIMAPQSVSDSTRLLLTNAIYFKSAWISTFDKRATQDQPFYVTPNTTVKTPFMHKRAFFGYGYAETPDFQALALAYKAPALSMMLILPKSVDGLPAIENTLTSAVLADLLSRMHGTEVELFLPKFQWTMGFGFRGVLSAMGMGVAFDIASADFSGITGRQELYISDVLHKTFLDVNEEGTEAAAVTAVPMAMSKAAPPEPKPPPVFRADHPFLLLIRETQSGAILFLGRYLHPFNAVR